MVVGAANLLPSTEETEPKFCSESLTPFPAVSASNAPAVPDTRRPVMVREDGALMFRLLNVASAAVCVVNHAKVEVTPAAKTAALMTVIAKVSLAFVFIK